MSPSHRMMAALTPSSLALSRTARTIWDTAYSPNTEGPNTVRASTTPTAKLLTRTTMVFSMLHRVPDRTRLSRSRAGWSPGASTRGRGADTYLQVTAVTQAPCGKDDEPYAGRHGHGHGQAGARDARPDGQGSQFGQEPRHQEQQGHGDIDHGHGEQAALESPGGQRRHQGNQPHQLEDQPAPGRGEDREVVIGQGVEDPDRGERRQPDQDRRGRSPRRSVDELY